MQLSYTSEEQTVDKYRELRNEFSFNDLINNGFFKNTMPFPSNKKALTTKICEHCGSKYEDKKAVEEYYQKRKEFGIEENRIHNLFVNCIFIEFGVELNKKAYEAFRIAWERGHSSGLNEVYGEFMDLVELIK